MERVRKRPVFPAAPKTRRVKVITAGCAGVGKSCLIKRYCERRFVSKYLPTIGVDYGITVWQAPHGTANSDLSATGGGGSTSNGGDAGGPVSLVRVNFYDMAGDDVYYSVRNEFYEYTQGLLLVFDVHKRRSFERLNDWLEELSSEMGHTALQQCVIVVCANKVDVEDPSATPATPATPSRKTQAAPLDPAKRAVSRGEAQLWAESHGFLYAETSAHTGYNVEKTFHALFVAVLETAGAKELPPSVNTATPTFTKEDLDAVTRVLAAKGDHAVLGLERGCDAAAVQRAYRSLASQVHPDKNRAPNSDAAFKRVLQAKDHLSSDASS